MSRDFFVQTLTKEDIYKKIQNIIDTKIKLNKKCDEQENNKLSAYIRELRDKTRSIKTWYSTRSHIAKTIYTILEEVTKDKTLLEMYKKFWSDDIIQKSKNTSWIESEFENEILTLWNSIQNVNLSTIPSLSSAINSFFIHFEFNLIEPLITKDESAFYIIDTPVRKDKTTGLPVMESTSWKGCLRGSIRQLKGLLDEEQERNDQQMIRLFGNIKNEEDEKRFRRGRLVFYPTFFYCFGLDIINPHNRENKVGERPIQIEVIPIGAKGAFTILYFPFHRIGREEANIEDGFEKTLKDEAAEDLIEVAKGIKAMFTQYGFGAKTSSGFGTAEIIKDSIVIQANDNGELKNEIDEAKKILGGKEGENE